MSNPDTITAVLAMNSPLTDERLKELAACVKPVTWRKTSYGMPEAETVAGIYRIVHAMNGGYTVTAKKVVLRLDDGRENFATLQDAIDAAEADYRQRILSTLDPTLLSLRQKDGENWTLEPREPSIPTGGSAE